PGVPPGSVVVFDDLFFPTNRLPDGSLCTWHTEPGDSGRAHWIFDRPFSEQLRRNLLDAARARGVTAVDRGCYGHVDGPRFNSRCEIAALARAGVSAVSQTAGPEVVLAGEAQLPMALLGYVTDYANGVATEAPVEELSRWMQASREVLADIVEAALPLLGQPQPVGVVYRIQP
ncbi:MAG: phosphorylase family protein, partial [Mycobacteriales bacterium]